MANDSAPINLDASADGTKQFADALAAMDAQEKLAAEAAERRKQYLADQKKQWGDMAPTIEKATTAHKGFLKSLQDGTYARGVKQLADLNRQTEQLRRNFDLTSRYGDKLGGFLSRHDNVLRPLGRAAGYATSAALVTGGGLVRSGFSGTVEQERFNREWKLLGREFAGAFRPVIETATKFTRGFREAMEKIGPRGQDALMYGGLAATGLGAYRYGGAAVSAAGGLLGIGGAARAAGGAASLTAANAAAATSVAASNRRGRPSLLDAGLWSAAAILTTAAIDAPSERPNERPYAYYDRMRRNGDTMAEAGLSTLGRAGAKIFGLTTGAKTEEQEKREAATANGRRVVTPAGGGWGAPLEGYERLNEAISRVEPARADSGTADFSDTLKRIDEALRSLNEKLDRDGKDELKRPGDS